MLMFKKKIRREPTQPNLTPMLDIFTILVLFLITSAVFGGSSISLLPGMLLPLSVLKNPVELAAQVNVTKDGVKSPFLKKGYPIDVFYPENRTQSSTSQLKEEIRRYIASLGPDQQKRDLLLNVVGDRSLNYESIYDVISLFREAGFQKISFMAQNQEGP